MCSSNPASVELESRTTKLNLHKLATQLLAGGLGLAYALVLALPLSAPSGEPTEPVRVVFKAAAEPPPPVAVDPEVVIETPVQTAAELPLETPIERAPEPPKRKEGTSAAETPKESSAPPVVESGLKPPAPPDIYAPPTEQFYAEKPGGPVLVLALLVDTYGNVYNARIVVPSHNPLADLTYMLSAPGLKLGPMKPEFPPGEQRWIEIRVRFNPPGDNLLP